MLGRMDQGEVSRPRDEAQGQQQPEVPSDGRWPREGQESLPGCSSGTLSPQVCSKSGNQRLKGRRDCGASRARPKAPVTHKPGGAASPGAGHPRGAEHAGRILGGSPHGLGVSLPSASIPHHKLGQPGLAPRTLDRATGTLTEGAGQQGHPLHPKIRLWNGRVGMAGVC